jgi:hypothetical protein
MTNLTEGADAAAMDTVSLPQDPSLKLASDLIEAARLTDESLRSADEALTAIHTAIRNMMAAFKAMASYVGAENMEMKGRIEELTGEPWGEIKA